MLDIKRLGNRIRARRKARGQTQEELGEAVGVSPQAVSKWETGDAAPDVGLLPAICSALDVSSDTLLGIEDVGFDAVCHEIERHIRKEPSVDKRLALKFRLLAHLHDLDGQGAAPGKDDPFAHVRYHWKNGSLQSLDLLVKNSISVVVDSAGLLPGNLSYDLLATLRLLTDPPVWGVVQLLLSGPAKEDAIREQGTDTVQTQEVLDRLIDARILIQDREGYRLEPTNGVILVGLLKALASLPKVGTVSQLFEEGAAVGS